MEEVASTNNLHFKRQYNALNEFIHSFTLNPAFYLNQIARGILRYKK
jgi:hypothetical protein